MSDGDDARGAAPVSYTHLDVYKRQEMGRGLNPQIPENYYPDDDPENKPVLTWRAHANSLYTNWLNYYVYQVTPYDLYGTPSF